MSAEVGLNKYEEVKTVPVVDLVFTSSKRSLIDRVSDVPLQFTRNTIGTYVDENGIIKTAAAGEPRYTYDLMTGESLGLLIEESRTNLVTNSENFSFWSTYRTTISLNAAISPSGQLNAAKFNVTTDTGYHARSFAVTGGTYMVSIFAKAGEYNGIQITGTNHIEDNACFNLVNGTAYHQGSYVTNIKIENFGNGWYRCSARLPLTNGNLFVAITDGISTSWLPSFAGSSATDGIYIWGAQIEAGSFPTSYIPTSGSTVTRDPDTVTLTNNNLYNNSEFDIINQPFGVAAGSNTLQLFPSDKPIKRVSVFSPNLTQTRVNQFAEKEDEFWKWRVLGSSFGLPNFLTDGQVTVDWGDGTIETLTTSDHTFTNGGGYHDIGFRLDSGTYFRPKIGGNAAVGDKIYSVGPAPESMKVDATQLFWNCDNLKSVDATFDIVNSANSAFYLCDNLKNIPKVNTTGITDFTNFARECTSLTSFPLLNTSSGVDFNTTWRGCNSLVSFPLLDTSSGTTFSAAWQDCTSLTSFPLLDTSSGTTFNSTWRGCKILTSFPSLNLSSNTNFNSTWRGCNSLTSFPLLDTSSGTGFNSTWRNCDSLTSFPLLDTSSGTSFNGAWASCSSLSDFPANLFDSWTATPSNGCFNVTWFDCPLTPTSVENIINSISISSSSFNPPPIDTEITIDYNAASGTPDITVPAVDLIAKGWIPTLNGSAKNDAYSSDFATLDLDFATNLSLTDNISGNNLVTFSRNSIGTYVDSNGVIQTAAIDTARFDHDPLTNESLGLLVEEERTNNAQRSDSISYATSSGSVTVNTTGTLAPDGTFTAVAYAPSQRPAGATYHEHGAIFPSLGSCPDGNIISIYAKMGPDPTLKYIHLRIFTSGYITTFNLEDGTFVENAPSTFPSTMTDVGNGWWRLTARNLTGSSTTLLRIYIGDNNSIANTPTGDEIYLWGLQNETGSFPTSYIPTPSIFTSRNSTATYYDENGVIQTAGVNVGRDDAYLPDENGTFYPAGLLLEDAETNYIQYSQDPSRSAKYRVYTSASNLTTGTIAINSSTGPVTAYVTAVVPVDANNCDINIGSISGVVFNPATFTQGGNTYNGNGNIGSLGYLLYNSLGTSDNIPVLSNVLSPDGISYAYEQTGDVQMQNLYDWTSTDYSVFSVFVKAKNATTIDISNEYHSTPYSTFSFTTGTWSYENPYHEQHFVEKHPNGWYRIGVLDTYGFRGFYSRITSTDSYYCWGFQYSKSSTMTSYIPSSGSFVTRAADVSSSASVTRAADVVTIEGTNFSSWFNQSEGTFRVRGQNDVPVSSSNSGMRFMSVSTGPSVYQDTTYIFSSNTTDYGAGFTTRGESGVADYNFYSYLGWTNTFPMQTYVGGYDSTSSTIGYNNLSRTQSISFALQNDLSHMWIGRNHAFAPNRNHIGRISYWPKKLTDKSIQFLSQ